MAKKRKTVGRWRELDDQRKRAADQAPEDMKADVRNFQTDGYASIMDRISTTMETADGRFVFNSRNLAAVSRVQSFTGRWAASFQRFIIRPIIRAARKLLGLNLKYFTEVQEMAIAEKVEQQARIEALRTWGYDPDKNEVLAGSFLSGVFDGMPRIAVRVGMMLNQAIAARMPLAQFQRMFRSIFVGAPGFGLLERHFVSATKTLFQRLDRAANFAYAKLLGLDRALYTGLPLIETSRQFCVRRFNKVFTIGQIESWAALDWAGKTQPYNPFLDCGGYNCRHHLSFITPAIQREL